MKLSTKGNIIKILSVFESGLWIAGLILGNIYIIILAILILLAITPVVYINRNNLQEMFQGKDSAIIEDERTQLINEKASTMTLGIYLAIIIWVSIILAALRDTYPQYLAIAYTLFGSAILCLILYYTSRIYYGRKY